MTAPHRSVGSAVTLLRFCRDRDIAVTPVVADVALHAIDDLVALLHEASVLAEDAVAASNGMLDQRLHLLAENAALIADATSARVRTPRRTR